MPAESKLLLDSRSLSRPSFGNPPGNPSVDGDQRFTL